MFSRQTIPWHSSQGELVPQPTLLWHVDKIGVATSYASDCRGRLVGLGCWRGGLMMLTTFSQNPKSQLPRPCLGGAFVATHRVAGDVECRVAVTERTTALRFAISADDPEGDVV